MSSSRPLYRICTRCRNELEPRSARCALSISRQPSRFLSSIANSSQPITTPLPTSAEVSALSPEIHSLPKSHILRAPHNQHQPASETFFTGHVSRTSTMPRTIQVTRNQQVWDKFLQKHYQRPHRVLARIPDEFNYPGAIREGDVVEYGVFNAEEQQGKIDKDKGRVERRVNTLLQEETAKATAENRPNKGMNSKGVRRYLRELSDEKQYAKGGGRKVDGVKFVVRRVVTPFGVGMEERLARTDDAVADIQSGT